MNNAEIKFKFITPCITAGADKLKAELRATAIRGQLRWWYRALIGDDGETDIFGGVQGEAVSSSLIVRIISENIRTDVQDGQGIIGNQFDYFLWPLKGTKANTNAGKRGVIKENQTVEISLSHRRNGKNTRLPENVLKAFLLLGALGTRSRRCYGSIWPEEVKIDGVKWVVPTNESDFIAELKRIFDVSAECRIIKIGASRDNWKSAVNQCAAFLKAFRCGSPRSGTPSTWGQNDHDVIAGGIQKVYRQAIGLPLTQRYSNGTVLESAIDGCDRWASPVHFKVIPINGQFMPIATVFPYHSPEDETCVSINRRNGPTINTKLDNDLLLQLVTPRCAAHRAVWQDSILLADFVPTE
jgi:CRISPR type III-B/RAMP module RAMP protein Cmr1